LLGSVPSVTMRGPSLFSSRAARKVEVAGKSLKRITTMRDIEVIDSELRLLFRAWRVARVLCDRMPSTALIDELLDERLAQRGGSLAGLVKQLVN
jgi:hypothetical protein